MLGYDSDDDGRHSPNLLPVHPTITPEKSPVPAAPPRAQHPMTSVHPQRNPGGQGYRPRRRRNQPSQGDAVLWQTAYPNHPDIAREAGRKPLLSGSEEDDDEEDQDDAESARSGDFDGTRDDMRDGTRDEDGRRQYSRRRSTNRDMPTRTSTTATLDTHFSAMNTNCTHVSPTATDRTGHDDLGIASEAGVTWSRGKGRANAADRNTHEDSAAAAARRDSAVSNVSVPDRDVDGEPPRKRTSVNDKTPVKGVKGTESIAQSPRLLPHILPGPQGSASVPFFQESPAPSRSATMTGQGQDSQLLPSVMHLINEVDTREQHVAAAAASTRARAASLSSAKSILDPPAPVNLPAAPFPQQPGIAQSPTQYTHQDQRNRPRTDSLPSLPQAYRPRSSAGQKRSFQNHQQRGSISSSHSGSIPVPPLSSTSTGSTSATTPTVIPESSAQTSPTDDDPYRQFSGDERLQGGAQPQVPVYKCNYPGCTALPFVTQYLLNSHKNVHSDDRPYYCSVPNCPRSRGGKGFKRRNEMLRHGLVHDSPGFICPFCGDGREHRYPRPDNLLRHVRMHHKEESTEDDRLRAILNRRPGPGGGGRGRRRRDTGGGGGGGSGGAGTSSSGAVSKEYRGLRASRRDGPAGRARGQSDADLDEPAED